MAVLKKIKFGNSTNKIQFTEVKPANGGVITATGANTDLDNVNNPEYFIDLTIANDGTLAKENGALKVDTVPAAQVSVADSGDKFEATNVEAALSELKEDIAEVGGAAKSYKIVEVTSPASSTSLKEYKVQVAVGDGDFADDTDSATIVVPKDNAFVTAQLGHTGATVSQETGAITDGEGEDALLIEYVNGSGVYTLVAVPIGAFLKEAEFKDGLQVNNSGEVSAKLGQGLEFGGETGEGVNQSIKVKVDSTSESFLSVGANGVKVSGVQDAINSAIDALDVVDTAETGKYVSSVGETNGKVSTTKANVSDAVLNGYTKGTVGTAVAATDTINEAFSKIEVRIDNNEQVTSAALNNINTKIEGMDKAADAVAGQVVTTVSETDGVVSETKAYVKDLQLGGYAKDASAKSPIGGTDTINTALSKLENAIDAAKAAATTKVVEGTDTGNNLEISSATSQTDGSTTYTINLTDVASKTALDAEIAARKAVDGQSGDTYAANANANYISAATSLNDADVKLDAALKAEETRAKSAETAIDGAVGLTKDASGEGRTYTNTGEYIGKETSNTVASDIKALDTQLKAVTDKVNAIQYKVTGTTLEFFEISEKTGA